jgi:hypothetical protein
MSPAEDVNLGKVQELVLRSVVRNGVRLKRAGAPEDLGKSFEEAEKVWDRGWVDRKQLKRDVYDHRDADVTEASNRVSVSRAVHRLVEYELLDGKFAATAVVVDGVMELHSYGDPGLGAPDIHDSDKSPTYSAVRVSNKGKRFVRSLRSRERNDVWDEAIRERQFI